MSEQDHTCSKCNKEITEKQCAVVDSKKYHVQCFNCNTCDKPLAGQKFHKRNGEANCEVCHLEKFAPTCGGCSKKIAGKHVVVEEKKFHHDCFVCAFCTSAFGSDGYFIEDEKYICKKCLASKRNRQCGKCNTLIEDDEIFAMEQYFHHECFKCAKCDKAVGDISFIRQDDKAFHPNCLNSVCVVCGHQCDGEYYQVENGNISHVTCVDKYNPKVHTKNPSPIVVSEKLQQNEEVSVQQKVTVQIQQQEEQKQQPEVINKKVEIQVEVPKKVEVLAEVVTKKPEQVVQVEVPKQVEIVVNVEVTKQPEMVVQVEVTKKPEQQVQVEVTTKPEQIKQSEPAPTIEPKILEHKQEVKQEGVDVQVVVDLTPLNLAKYELKTMESQDPNALDSSCLDPERVRYSVTELQKNPPPAGIPLNKKELYLSDADFEKIFKMKMNRFLALKEQKRAQLKKQAGLF